MNQHNIDKQTMQKQHEEASKHHQEASKHHQEAANFHKSDKHLRGMQQLTRLRDTQNKQKIMHPKQQNMEQGFPLPKMLSL